ncbi:PLP-dependent aminotransferase family protein [Streptomyces vilmorinianum]|uniref:MocR-like pyridoxine biosynthesis transcription factor PdxR n=1 Tax=Streptomyces vilmorinianum TaxID=3051092 RepID=UPI0020C76500|nr:PLP-dependent aminotransferase family protein [Streptomyces vilmorinianum]
MTTWLVDAVRDAVADGRLTSGVYLPASRVLADDLKVSRGVVVEAYRRLAEEGLVSGRPGAGTRVTAEIARTPLPGGVSPPPEGAHPPAARLTPYGDSVPRLPLARPEPPVDIDLSPGLPDLSGFPRSAWWRAERAVLGRAPAAEFAYGDPRGSLTLRQELASWLGRVRGVRAEPEDIIVVGGVAQSLALVAQTLRAAGGARIAVEDPGSRGAQDALAHWGMQPVAVPVDEQGLVVEELVRSGLRTALVTPAHQFPTGVVLAPQRRRALLAWANEGGLVVEDDYDAEHRYDRSPVPALQASAPERVVHTGSISKTLAPAMRLGWLIAPRSLRDELVAAKHASDLGSPILPQLVLARLISHGDLDRHLRLTRGRYRARRDALLTALTARLPSVHVQGIAAGLHLLVVFPELTGKVADTDLSERLLRAGVLTHPLSWHRGNPGPPGLVLGYAAHPADRLREAAHRIARTVQAARRTIQAARP